MLNFENLDHAQFIGEGKYNIPFIAPPETSLEISNLEWIPFNFAKTAKEKKNKGIHFFVDDYQFIRLWNRPNEYISLLSQFGAVLSPDFSMYTDMPMAMQIYNNYRRHWLGAYWQRLGITVIPTIGWSTPESYEWCFDGDPENSIVAISTVGTQKNKKSKELFNQGYEQMLSRLHPTKILCYGGTIATENDDNIVHIKPYYDTIVKKRRKK
jgi:hypothetical protein